MNKGICYLVGAGPGDPGLITVKGRECLEFADIVYYDYLSSDELLEYAPDDAARVYVGKSAGNHTVAQEEICRMLVDSVTEGKTVVRLKGGDPYVFGRGGEEALALHDAGLAYEIIPGVTSGVAAAAYAGIPVTHRNISTAVTFVTGHEAPGKSETQTNWQALAESGATLCIFMGVGKLAEIAQKLIECGRPENEPVAVIARGTQVSQHTVAGTLSDIAQKVSASGLNPPAMTVVGKVVALRDQLNWFEAQPLFGKKIVVTRSREQAGVLSHLLESHGAQVVEAPAISIIPVDLHCSEKLRESLISGKIKIIYTRENNPMLLSILQESPLDVGEDSFGDLIDGADSLTIAIAKLVANYHDYVVFTSVNGVEQTFERIAEFGLDSRVFVGKDIAAIGPATADALAGYGLNADIIPEVFTGEKLAEAFSEFPIKDKKIALLRASNARAFLRESLTEKGAVVDDIVAYYVGKCSLEKATREELLSGSINAVTFASSGTVRNFIEMLGEDLKILMSSETRPVFVSIGPVTSATMRELKLPVDVEAHSATISSMVETLLEYYR